jgi:hypothetical protein
MFDFFKNSSKDILAEMDKKWYDSLREVHKAIEKLQSTEFMPICTQDGDITTVTFKGPNVTTTITTKTADLPAVLKQYGLVMPTAAKKPATRAKAK